jgi:hypothetical protein
MQLLSILSVPTLLQMATLTLVLRNFFEGCRLARKLEFAWIP